jgi:hypothetical protein
MPPRIPRLKSRFNDYINNVTHHINATEPGSTVKRGEILGMTADEIIRVNDFFSKWHSADPEYPGFYDMHRNRDTRTKTTRKNTEKLMKDFSGFFRVVLCRIFSSAAITSQDCVVLHIAEPNMHRTFHTTPITEKCDASAVALGGGELSFVCRYTTDSKRAGKPPLSDAVEVAYAVIDGNFQSGADPSHQVKHVIMGPDDGTNSAVFTKARFILRLNARFARMELQFYVRWINTKQPELAGPWNGPYIVVIL